MISVLIKGAGGCRAFSFGRQTVCACGVLGGGEKPIEPTAMMNRDAVPPPGRTRFDFSTRPIRLSVGSDTVDDLMVGLVYGFANRPCGRQRLPRMEDFERDLCKRNAFPSSKTMAMHE